jgi:hypothetical protein
LNKCSLLSESAYHAKHNQLAKIIHQLIDIKYKLLEKKTVLHAIDTNQKLCWN